MVMFTQTLFSAVLTVSTALAAPHIRPHAPVAPTEPKCPIVFDGRVPVQTTPTFFDTAATNTIFNADFVKGNNLTWSQILKFPRDSSRFDGDKFKAIEVTISDESIFQKQQGFRRAGLLFLEDAPDGEGAKGVKTLHWSVKQDPARPLNLTHEYLNVWHEAADYSNNQIQFQTGSLIGKSDADKDHFKMLDPNGFTLFSVPMDMCKWQNFATKLDYNNKYFFARSTWKRMKWKANDWDSQVTIFYSVGNAPLKAMTGPLPINLAGGGQYQLGILKKPTGTSDVVNDGFQESHLNEGQIYGGVFLEDSIDGCVSL